MRRTKARMVDSEVEGHFLDHFVIRWVQCQHYQLTLRFEMLPLRSRSNSWPLSRIQAAHVSMYTVDTTVGTHQVMFPTPVLPNDCGGATLKQSKVGGGVLEFFFGQVEEEAEKTAEEEPHLLSRARLVCATTTQEFLRFFGQVKGPTQLERGRFRSEELVSTSGQHNIGLPHEIESSVSPICCM